MINTMQTFKYQQIKTNVFMIFAITTTHERVIHNCMTMFIIDTPKKYICKQARHILKINILNIQ